MNTINAIILGIVGMLFVMTLLTTIGQVFVNHEIDIYDRWIPALLAGIWITVYFLS